MNSGKSVSHGDHVRITNYGPFRGLRGTILQIDTIVDDLEDPFCFYLVSLEKASFAEAFWFEHHEVEFISTPSLIPVCAAAATR